MDALRRQRYLEALGIDSWALRHATAADPGIAAPVTDARAMSPQPPQDTPVEALAANPTPSPDQTPAAEPRSAGINVPQDWEGLRACVRDCTACSLSQTRTQSVFGVGPENADLMVIGEGPGADEDARGEPFVGRAGQLLDQMLAAIGHARQTNVFIANVVKCRPPGNRDPRPEEAEACRGYLERQIELVRPRLLLALGRVAAQRLLDTSEPLSRLRKDLHHYGPGQTPLLVTYHPAYLLRSPREKARSWADLKRAVRLLEGAAQ